MDLKPGQIYGFSKRAGADVVFEDGLLPVVVVVGIDSEGKYKFNEHLLNGDSSLPVLSSNPNYRGNYNPNTLREIPTELQSKVLGAFQNQRFSKKVAGAHTSMVLGSSPKTRENLLRIGYSQIEKLSFGKDVDVLRSK